MSNHGEDHNWEKSKKADEFLDLNRMFRTPSYKVQVATELPFCLRKLNQTVLDNKAGPNPSVQMQRIHD